MWRGCLDNGLPGLRRAGHGEQGLAGRALRRNPGKIRRQVFAVDDLALAEEDIKVALSKKPEEAKYHKHSELLAKRRAEKLHDDSKFVENIVSCAKRCVEFNRAKQLATSQTQLETPQEVRIMRVLKHKYADCMEFFRDTEDPKQVLLTVKDFRQFSLTSYQKMMRVYKFRPERLEPELLQTLAVETRMLLNDEQILKEIDNLRVRDAIMLFGGNSCLQP